MATNPVSISTTPPTAETTQGSGGCGCGGCGCGAGEARDAGATS